MTGQLERCLEDLEKRIEEVEEQALWDRWREFNEGRFTGDLFAPRRAGARPAGVEWPTVSVNQALDDFEAMVLQQLGTCSEYLASANGMLLAVRANYGTPLLTSLFGAEIFRMPEELNTLPASRPLSPEARRRAVAGGVPEVHQSLGGQALETGARYVELFRSYPKTARHVHIYHPDTQGPMDLCEMLWGSSIFVAAYEQPEEVHALLEVVTETYITYLREWEKIVPWREDGVEVHWGPMHRGHIMLRDDSAMNFSPAMYEEFFVPYEQRLLEEFGGGVMHFCGRGDHYIALATAMEGMYGINMSQPELNDMEVIYRHTVDKGMPLIGFSREWAEKALAAGRELRGLVQVG